MMNKPTRLTTLWQTACTLPLLLASGAVLAQVGDLPGGPKVRQLNLHEPATQIAAQQQWLHWMMLIICSVIFIGVFGVMFYSILKHRKSLGHKPANFHESVSVEIAWTVIPFIIVIAMGAMATRTVVAMKDTSNADLTIKATGYQWKWGYEYLEDDVRFFSSLATPRDQIDGRADKGEHYLLEVDNPVVVPVGKKVRVLTTANDVLHAWYVPALAVKQDAIPGFIRDTWFRAEQTGTFRGQCAELCGKEHGFMPIVVKVVTEEEYRAWVNQQKQTVAAPSFDPDKVYSLADLNQQGEGVYQMHCAACHMPDGSGMAPVFPPIKGSKIATGPKGPHMDMVIHGSKKNPAMMAFGSQLSDLELAAVLTYQRNALGNSTGDVIQPGDVMTAR
jgi:cytochrome c oxidase subunit II